MFTTAKEKPHFNEYHVHRLLTPEINRLAFHVQIVLANVPLRGQHPVGKYVLAHSIPHLQPGAGSRSCPALSLPSILRNYTAAPTGMPAPGISASTPECQLPYLLPASATGYFSMAHGSNVWMYTELRDRPRSHPAAADLSSVSSLPPGALKAGCPFCPRLWSAVRTSPG